MMALFPFLVTSPALKSKGSAADICSMEHPIEPSIERAPNHIFREDVFYLDE
jgi:hypothetical protein